MKYLLIIILIINTFVLAAQAPASIVQINDSLTAHRYEFSALAKWRDKIVLVPQNRKNVVDSIYLIDSSIIDQSIQKNSFAMHTAFAIKNIKHAGTKKDSLYIHDILIDHYDGFEACVTKDDTIFFSLEADTSFCYIIKGIINAKSKSVDILADTLHVPNTYNINNAGYESLAFLPNKDSLIAFFECNKDEDARAYMFGTNLKSNLTPIEWEKPLYFRITDVYALNNSELIGVNHLFTSASYPYERDAYMKCVDLSLVERQLTNGGNIDTCFTQLVKLTICNNKIDWKPLAFISLDAADNYEGVVSFKDGALMMVDGEPGNNPCKLIYVSLK